MYVCVCVIYHMYYYICIIHILINVRTWNRGNGWIFAHNPPAMTTHPDNNNNNSSLCTCVMRVCVCVCVCDCVYTVKCVLVAAPTKRMTSFRFYGSPTRTYESRVRTYATANDFRLWLFSCICSLLYPIYTCTYTFARIHIVYSAHVLCILLPGRTRPDGKFLRGKV